MATHVYEGMFLLDSNRYARDPNGVSTEIDKIVSKCGGEILVSRLWSEQRLAYEIEGHRKGTYWLTYFRLDSLQQPAITRACQLSENILRNLVLKVDHRLVDTLVKHAGPEEAAADKPAAGPEAASKEAVGKPATGKPATDKPDAGKPDAGKPAADKPDAGTAATTLADKSSQSDDSSTGGDK